MYRLVYQLFAIIVCIITVETNGQLLWDDPNINDKHCVYPPGINFPQIVTIALEGLNQRSKLYSPMANKTYYRWVYHKAKNTPAMTQNDLDSLQLRVIFPDLTGLFTVSQSTLEIFNPPSAYYKLLCIPNNVVLSNATCLVKNASPGSAPYGFGTGYSVISTIIWADSTAFAEWHCFEGDRQVFNVISLNSNLTQHQIDEISNVVVSFGFSTDNIAYQIYT